MCGLPILTCETIDGWIKEQGFVWSDVRPPVPLQEWITEEGRPVKDVGIVKRFAPEVKVLEQRRPDGTIFPHFVVDEGRGILIFCLLPNFVSGEDDFVVLTAEPKSWGVSIMPPGGRWNEKEDMKTCCLREFREETGIVLDAVEPLVGGRAIPYHRRLGGRGDGTFWFRGIAGEQIRFNHSKKDASEPVRPFLMTLSGWRALCHKGGSKYAVVEVCGSAITFVALPV